jgi:hypothetical protein
MTLLYQLQPLFGAECDDRMILNTEIEFTGVTVGYSIVE